MGHNLSGSCRWICRKRVDFYVFTGHKWLCGPEGVGGLYSQPEARSQLLPTWLGWRGVEKNAQGWRFGLKAMAAAMKLQPRLIRSMPA